MTAGALLLTGCSQAESAAEGGELSWDESSGDYVMEDAIASGAEPLTVWVEYEAYGEALKAAFAKLYPDVTVNMEVVAKVDAVNRMALDGEAGKGADVFTTNYTDLGNAIDGATAAPMGKYDEELTERVGDTFAEVVSRDEQMYAVPISTESISLFYNKTLLKELTGSDVPAATWEQISDLAATYNDSATNTWTIRFLSGELYYAYPVLSSLGWHLYPDGDLADPQLDSAELTAGLEYYAGLREIWDVNSADATYDSIENEFAKGDTPYVITGPWTFGDFDAGAEANGFEYGVTTLPIVEGGDTAASLAGLGVAVVSGYSEYPAAARVFANFMASDEAASALYDATGAIPALTAEHFAAIDGLADDQRAAGILAQSQNADLTQQIPEYLYTTGNSLVSNVWDRLLDVPAAQEKAVSGYSELFDLAG